MQPPDQSNYPVPATQSGPRAATPSSSPGSTVAALVVLVGVTLVAAGFLWRELDLARETAREHDAAVLRLAETDRATLRNELAAAQQLMRELAEREDALEHEQAALRARTDAGRGAFALAEARHLIELANESLHLAHDPERARDALRAADARLAGLGDGSLVAARAELAKQLATLGALPRSDVPGLAIALLALGDKVGHLPLRTRLPDATPPPVPPDVVTPTAWEHFIERVQQAFRGLVTVRRAPGGAEPLLAPDQEFFLRRNLELKLESARLAALGRDGVAFHASVVATRDWLAVYFDPAAPEVREAVRDLDAMSRLDLAPPLPDLSRALTLLDQRGTR